VGLDAQGKCEWKSECVIDADCVAAIDARRCCPCAAGYPRSLLALEPCLVQQPMTDDKPYPPAGCKELPTCDAVKCKPCGDPPPVTCSESFWKDGTRVCVPWQI
jgi:hypothetical protein